jgi:thiol-disulfide isomerase/thioredoxin
VTPGRRAAVVVAIASACLLLQLRWISEHLDWLRPLVAGNPAPRLALVEVSARGHADGATIDLQNLRGQVVVIDFWATWCGPCLRSLPALDAAAHRWGDSAVTLAVNVDDAVRARELFAQRGYSLTLLADDGNTADRYGVRSLPHTVVVDRDGIVVVVSHDLSTVIAAVDRLRTRE